MWVFPCRSGIGRDATKYGGGSSGTDGFLFQPSETRQPEALFSHPLPDCVQGPDPRKRGAGGLSFPLQSRSGMHTDRNRNRPRDLSLWAFFLIWGIRVVKRSESGRPGIRFPGFPSSCTSPFCAPLTCAPRSRAGRTFITTIIDGSDFPSTDLAVSPRHAADLRPASKGSDSRTFDRLLPFRAEQGGHLIPHIRILQEDDVELPHHGLPLERESGQLRVRIRQNLVDE